MTADLLDFPTIEAPPPVVATPAPTPVAVVTPAAVAEVAPSIKDAVLAQFKDAAVDILALAEKYRDVAFDVTTTKGMNEAKAARLELREKGRFAVQRAEKSVKADVNDLKRVMSDEVDRLVAIVQPVEDAIDAQIKAEEKRKADEKAERERIEAERVAKHRERLAKIPAYLTHCQQPGMTAARIAAGIELLAKTTFGTDWQEFAVPAANAQCETLEAMRKLHAQAVEREAETVRLEAQRAEQERIAEQQAEAQRQLDAQAATLAANVARVNGLQARINEIHAAATGHDKAKAWDLFEAVVAVENLNVSEDQYQELAPLAAAAQASTLAALNKLHTEAVAREDAAAEIQRVLAIPLALTIPPEPPLCGECVATTEYPEAQGIQQVLKAEPATAEATDRDAPADTSPHVGAMGAGQAADADPILEPGNPPFAAVDMARPDAVVVLHGESLSCFVAPLGPTTQAVELEAELEQCRAALTQALALLDELICKPPTKKDAARLFARVSELRDMGHLPRTVL